MVGIDPRPFSLRQLMWMADGKEGSEWVRCYRLVQYVAASGFSPRRILPAEVIPARYLPDGVRGRSRFREKVENDLGWAFLERGLRNGVPN